MLESESLIGTYAAPVAGPEPLSPTYGFVRGRQLEGTFPGEPGTGVWPITTWRTGYGWGKVSATEWSRADDAQWPPIEPEGLDRIAKKRRSGRYQRARNLEDCKRAVAAFHPPVTSFRITEDWPAGDAIVQSEEGSPSIDDLSASRVQGHHDVEDDDLINVGYDMVLTGSERRRNECHYAGPPAVKMATKGRSIGAKTRRATGVAKKELDGDRARKARGGVGSSKTRNRPANPNFPERGDIFFFLLILIFWYECAFERTA